MSHNLGFATGAIRGQVAGSCGNGSEPPGSVNGVVFLNQMSDYYLVYVVS